MHEQPEPLPTMCNPSAFEPAAWAEHRTTTAWLFAQATAAPTELPDGYAFRFPAANFPAVATFIDGERRCCPFFTFQLDLPPAEGEITLRITGGPEAKRILAITIVGAVR